MTSRNSKFVLLIVALLAVAAGVAVWGVALPALRLARAQDLADPHDDHGDHDEETHEQHTDGEKEAHDEDGHDEDGHEEDGHEDDPAPMKITPEQMRKFGIELATAGPGKLHQRVRSPGQIVIHADRAAHIVPPAPGTVRKVIASVGDTVRKGDVLALIDSAELGEAKTQYLAKLGELNCCAVELTRAKALQDSARKLLALLEKSPTLDELRKTKLTELGQGHGKLVDAYAELVLARATYEREKTLRDVSSRADFQVAESAYKKAYIKYVVARSSVAFEITRAVLEAQQLRRNNELTVQAAGRKLNLLGLTGNDVEHLQEDLAPADPSARKPCSDPNCTNCPAPEPSKPPAPDHRCDQQLGLYSLRAPFDGTVIRRHIALGEMVGESTDVFLIADMSDVWVDLKVHQKDLPYIRKGQRVRIVPGPGVPEAEGTISLISPILEEATRTCLARVVLPNPAGALRPGLFVTAHVAVRESNIPVLAPKDAVRRIESKPVVFVPVRQGLMPRPVTLGRSSRTHVEIVSGLRPGEKYVVKGAFALQAKIVTTGLGAHAGHGH